MIGPDHKQERDRGMHPVTSPSCHCNPATTQDYRILVQDPRSNRTQNPKSDHKHKQERGQGLHSVSHRILSILNVVGFIAVYYRTLQFRPFSTVVVVLVSSITGS